MDKIQFGVSQLGLSFVQLESSSYYLSLISGFISSGCLFWFAESVLEYNLDLFVNKLAIVILDIGIEWKIERDVIEIPIDNWQVIHFINIHHYLYLFIQGYCNLDNRHYSYQLRRGSLIWSPIQYCIDPYRSHVNNPLAIASN